MTYTPNTVPLRILLQLTPQSKPEHLAAILAGKDYEAFMQLRVTEATPYLELAIATHHAWANADTRSPKPVVIDGLEYIWPSDLTQLTMAQFADVQQLSLERADLSAIGAFLLFNDSIPYSPMHRRDKFQAIVMDLPAVEVLAGMQVFTKRFRDWQANIHALLRPEEMMKRILQQAP